MNTLHATARLPRSGNAALTAGALIQAALGIEFVLAGLSKLANPNFAAQFKTFVEASPGAKNGILAPPIQLLIVPNVALAANLATFTELGAGFVLLVAAIEVARRRFAGRLGSQHVYEPAVALLSSAAAIALGGLSLMIYLIEGGGLPKVNPASAFGSPIAIELLIVPLAFGIAWLEFGRFRALKSASRTSAVDFARVPKGLPFGKTPSQPYGSKR
jgi:hypothetical protein